MYAVDFEYDGQYLSDYGFIICDFDSSGGINVSDQGSRISFKKVSMNQGKSYSLTSANYEGCLSATFDICKNPDLHDYEQMEISVSEYRNLARWLNRREFLRFRIFDLDETEEERFYNVSFNISKIKIAEKTYGVRLSLESDKPFGYGQKRKILWDFTDTSVSKTLTDVSDEIGYIYPSMKIICKESGDLSIFNEMENCTMLIRNCSVGEVITIDGDSQIISSSLNSHDICNDFNYEFLRIGNTINNRSNIISVSKLCEIEISYFPIIKDTI